MLVTNSNRHDQNGLPNREQAATSARLKEVFHRRAQQLSQRGRRDAARAKETPFLVFRSGQELYGIALSCVKQVFSNLPITPVPGTDGFVLGVANLDGALLSVIDLRELLNLTAPPSHEGYIVLLHVKQRKLAIWVDALEGVSPIALDQLAAAKNAAGDSQSGLIKGVADNRVQVIDAIALLARAHRSKGTTSD